MKKLFFFGIPLSASMVSDTEEPFVLIFQNRYMKYLWHLVWSGINFLHFKANIYYQMHDGFEIHVEKNDNLLFIFWFINQTLC